MTPAGIGNNRLRAVDTWAYSPEAFGPLLHRALLVSQRDTHFFQGRLVERAGDLQALCLLVLFQTCAGGVVQLACLLTTIEITLLQNSLRLLNLGGGRMKDRTATGTGFVRGLRVRIRILSKNHCPKGKQKAHYDPGETLHFYSPEVRAPEAPKVEKLSQILTEGIIRGLSTMSRKCCMLQNS